MVDAEHTPSGDAGFRASLLKAVVGALGLVAFVAVVFGAIGMLGRADDLAVGDLPEEAADDPGATPDDLAEDAEPDPGLDPDPEDPMGPEDPADDPDPAPEEPDEAEPDEAEPDAVDRAFAPGDVTVQVLDGYQQDGGAAAAEVAALLRDEGYRVVAENPAIAYEITTVLWTAGFEAEARQVAAEIGAGEVRAQPGNLSTQVQVHVVVGADRG